MTMMALPRSKKLLIPLLLIIPITFVITQQGSDSSLSSSSSSISISEKEELVLHGHKYDSDEGSKQLKRIEITTKIKIPEDGQYTVRAFSESSDGTKLAPVYLTLDGQTNYKSLSSTLEKGDYEIGTFIYPRILGPDGILLDVGEGRYKIRIVLELAGSEPGQETKTVIDKFIETKSYTKDDLLVDDAS